MPEIKLIFKRIRDKLISLSAESEKKKDMLLRYYSIVFVLIVIAVLIIVKAFIVVIFEKPIPYISKDIKIEFNKAIHKGCQYEGLKYILDCKKRVYLYSANEDLYFRSNIPIDLILTEMIVDYYENEGYFYDSIYHSRIYSLKEEARIKYPFDKLSSSQKKLFENIKESSGDKYQFIENDIVGIANEIHDKNNDIERYLDKANQSYYISIVAFLITLIQFINPGWKYFNKKFRKND